MRKPLLLAASVLLLGAAIARADVEAQPIPADFLAQVGPFVTPVIAKMFAELPVKVDPALDKISGFHVNQEAGVVLIPDKALTAKSAADAADKEVPVGVFTSMGLTVKDKDKAVEADKVAKVELEGLPVKLPAFLLSVKGKGDTRTLEVYSKDKTPVTEVTLKKGSGEEAISMKLTKIEPKKSMDMELHIGAYEGTVKLAYLE